MLEGVPALPEMRGLTLEDRALIEEAAAREGCDGSEFTFTNRIVKKHIVRVKA